MVRVGIIGVGYWGPNIVRNLHARKNAEIAGVCDLSLPALERIKSSFPAIPLFTSFQDLLNQGKPDAVIIVTPAATHAALARQALKEGLHVLVEKPLATNSADALDLIRIAERNDLILMAGHTFLYSNYVRTVKQLVDAGQIGNLRYLYSQRLSLGQIRSDVDALWNLGPHDISILNYFTGSTPESVSAWGIATLNPDSGLSDVVFGKMIYPGNVTGHIHLSWLDPQKVRRTVLVGTEKMLVYDDTDTKVPVRILDKAAVQGPDGRFSTCSGKTQEISIDLPEPLGIELAHFISCICSGEQPLTDGWHALEVIAVLEAMSESLKNNGMPVDVKLPGKPGD